LLSVFGIFAAALDEEEEGEKQRSELLALRTAERQDRREKRRKLREEREAAAQAEAVALEAQNTQDSYSCMACTFHQAWHARCEICETPNPGFMRKPAGLAVKGGVEHEDSSSEDEADDDDLKPKVSYANILFHRLRFRALKAFSSLLLNTPNPPVDTLTGSLSILLSMAVRPTSLASFRSLAALEDSQDRLSELLVETGKGQESDIIRFRAQMSRNELTHSPFKDLPLEIPKQLDLDSAKNLRFLDDALLEVRVVRPANVSGGLGESLGNLNSPNSPSNP